MSEVSTRVTSNTNTPSSSSIPPPATKPLNSFLATVFTVVLTLFISHVSRSSSQTMVVPQHSYPLFDWQLNTSFHASTDTYHDGNCLYAAHRVRMSQQECYHPADGQHQNAFVWVDLGRNYTITEMELRGRGKEEQFVTSFEIHYKVDPAASFSVLNPLTMNGLEDPTFRGLKHDRDVLTVKNFVPFQARFVKIVPKGYSNVPALKWEVYGYETTINDSLYASYGPPEAYRHLYLDQVCSTQNGGPSQNLLVAP